MGGGKGNFKMETSSGGDNGTVCTFDALEDNQSHVLHSEQHTKELSSLQNQGVLEVHEALSQESVERPREDTFRTGNTRDNAEELLFSSEDVNEEQRAIYGCSLDFLKASGIHRRLFTMSESYENNTNESETHEPMQQDYGQNSTEWQLICDMYAASNDTSCQQLPTVPTASYSAYTDGERPTACGRSYLVHRAVTAGSMRQQRPSPVSTSYSVPGTSSSGK
jgi:hypothetical protein